MLTKVVLIGLLIVLFLWVLYERKCARDLLKERLKREGYQFFTFNYTDEAPKEDFSGEHPEYQFREFYREHFSEFGRTFSDSSLSPGCPSSVCSNVQANSLTNINPISVDSSGFVMTLDMGRLPRQYHYRTTNKNSGVYTGLDEAMVWNGFDINHEKSSMPGHNPNVRGFAGECQKTTNNCSTDTATGKRTCQREETVKIGGDSTDLNSMEHFMHKSTDLNDMKKGLGNYLDKLERVVFVRIGMEDKNNWILTKTPNRNLLFAYGRFGSYTFGTLNTGPLGPLGYARTTISKSTINTLFGDPFWGTQKSIYLAFQLTNQDDYNRVLELADAYIQSYGAKDIKNREYDKFGKFVMMGTQENIFESYGPITQIGQENDTFDFRNWRGNLLRYERSHNNVWGVFSDQVVYATNWFFDDIDPSPGETKLIWRLNYPGEFLLLENDILPPFIKNQDVINAPNVGTLKAIQNVNGFTFNPDGYEYARASGLNPRTASVFDQTPVLLQEPISGVCSMTNVTDKNIAFPDFSDPNSSTYMTLNPAKGDSGKLFVSGPSKLTSLYSSELLTLEQHRNSVAYGGFVMNSQTTSTLFQPSYNPGPLSTMRNECTIQSGDNIQTFDIRKRLIDAGIAGSPDCDSQNYTTGCVPSPFARLYRAIGIINDRGNGHRHATVILFKFVEWNMIRWFAHSKGIPSLAQWNNQIDTFFSYFYLSYAASEFGAFLWQWWIVLANLREKYQDIYYRLIAPLTFKDAKIYRKLATEINAIGVYLVLTSSYQNEYFSNSSITQPMNQFLFDLFYCPATTTRVRALLNSYDPLDSKRTWIYALYPEDRKRSRIYFDGYAADSNSRWASGAFSVGDGRAVVVPRKFTRGTDAQMTMVNSFPRVYSVIKFYSSSNDVIFTLFWAHIPLYPGCGYPTMNYEITDKYGKPDFMNNNYSDNIFIFYLIGSESKWKQEIIDNGIDPICEEDFYIESVYHGSAMCLRSIDNASKRLNCGNYVLFAEDGLTATVAPKDTNASETLGGEMGSFRLYCDEKGVFVYKRKISTNAEALQDYTVYSDYISVPGMKSCTGFSCWTPFREANWVQSVFKSIRVEPPLLGDSLDSSKPPSAATPVQVTATDNYRNLAQKREMIQTYASLKHPTHPARVNTPVIKNINVLKAEGWRIVNVGGSGWVDPATTVLNPYKVQQKEDYNTAPYNVNYKSYETADAYGGAVGAMVSKWGLPTQTKYITRGEWIQLNFPVARQFNYYQIIVPEKYCKRSYIVAGSENPKNTLPNNRSISDWTLLASNDETVDKRWVVIDIQKDLRFGDEDYNGVGAGGNNFLINTTYFIGYLKDMMTYKYIRLVINGLHPNNFENIFSLDYFGVGGFPVNGADDGTVVTTSITPFGFDNNYNYSDALKRPLVPVITAEGYTDEAYNNYSMGRYTLLSTAGGIGEAPFIYYHKPKELPRSNPSNMKIHHMDNRWSYTTNLANTLSKAENWKKGTVTKDIGIPTTDFNEIRRNTSATLRSYFTNSSLFVNITLGNYLFTWPELHMFMDTAAYSLMAQDGQTQYYDTFISYTLFHYTKMARDGAWRRSYNLSLDKLERYYEGSTITTYTYPCTFGDTAPTTACISFLDQPKIAGINNLRPDQEIADERFTWPQPYQGGSYLVSSSVRCVAGQTCNSVGGNTNNVTPKYCFWIGDAATYSALVNAQFPVQQDFNMNIMFDGDSNVYNDVPSQCLGKLTLNNLDFSPLSQFYPPPALYRQKGWKLIDDPSGLNLWSGGVKLKNAMISENNQVVFTFPDVDTALAYKEFDPNTGETTKVFNGCQGPSMVGTNVTISCPAGKLKATSGGAEESKPHIRWGKWNTSTCRDSFGDNLIEAPFRELPSRCVGQSTCTITEADFGWSNPLPRDTSWDVVSGVTRLSLFGVDGQHQFSSVSEIRVWTSPYSFVYPDGVGVSQADWDKWRIYDYGNYESFWDPPHQGSDHWVTYYFNNPINVYKIDVVGGHIPVRLAGMIVELYSYGTTVWTSCPILRADGGGDYRYVEDKPSYKYTSMWPGISRALFSSNSRVANWWEFPVTTYAYNPPDDAKITGAKTVCINYENVSGGVRALQISDVKIYTAPKTMLPSSSLSVSSSSTLGGYPDTNIKDDTPTFWHSTDERNPGLMISLPDNTPIYKITVGNRPDCCSNRMTGVIVTIRNSEGRVLFKSDKFQNKDATKTEYFDGDTGGYKYYGVYPAFSSAVYPADSELSIATPNAANLYQKRQWQVGFQCDYSDLSRVQRYQIPVGITSRQLHENYYNLMKQVNHQTVGVYDIRDYPETLKWYGESMKQEVLSNPVVKDEIRKKEREHYRALKKSGVDSSDDGGGGREHSTTGREHYWDGDICKPIGEVFETVANGVLEGIYNPIVSGINKIGLLKRGLGLTTQTVSIDWSCPIPGLGEAIGAIVNAAIAVGQAFVAAFNFVCELGEALVGAVINAGKYLFNRLGQVFTKERLTRFFRGFSNGLTGGYSLIGSITDNFSWVGDALSNLGNLVVNLGNSVAQFFMNPSIDNFVAVIGNLLTLGIEAFIFVLEIGLSIIGFFADLIGAFIGFIADIGNWIVNSVVGPIIEALSSVASWITSWLCFWC